MLDFYQRLIQQHLINSPDFDEFIFITSCLSNFHKLLIKTIVNQLDRKNLENYDDAKLSIITEKPDNNKRRATGFNNLGFN